MGIKVNVDSAKSAGYKYNGKKPLDSNKNGVKFAAEDVGDVCYVGPCVNGEREVYYFNDDGCTDGPYYTDEGCD